MEGESREYGCGGVIVATAAAGYLLCIESGIQPGYGGDALVRAGIWKTVNERSECVRRRVGRGSVSRAPS